MELAEKDNVSTWIKTICDEEYVDCFFTVTQTIIHIGGTDEACEKNT
jgi:hypothetical protein